MIDHAETTATDTETAATVTQAAPKPAPPATEPPPLANETAAKPKKRGRPKGSGTKNKKRTAAKKPAQNKKGRPPGTGTEKKPEVVGTLTRCPYCKSTNREKYRNSRSMQFSGIDPKTGEPYNLVTWKRTSCSDCNRARIDKFYELVKSK